jgi:hypothetical protein
LHDEEKLFYDLCGVHSPGLEEADDGFSFKVRKSRNPTGRSTFTFVRQVLPNCLRLQLLVL